MVVNVKFGILIKKAPDVVFAYLDNVQNFPKWQHSLHHINRVNSTANGNLGAQATIADSRNVLGKQIDSAYKVTGYVPDRQLSLTVVEGPVSFQMTWDLQPQGGGTFLTASGGGDLGDLGLSDQAANDSCQQMLESDLATLRTLIEAQ